MATKNIKLTSKTGNVVEISRRAEPRITIVERCSHDDVGTVIVVTAKSDKAASELAGTYAAWGLVVVEVERNCLVVAA
jgi:hypothetical protein